MIASWVNKALRRLRLGSLSIEGGMIDLRVRDRRLLYFNAWDQTCNELAQTLQENETIGELRQQEVVVREETQEASTRCLVCRQPFYGRGFRCPECLAKGRNVRLVRRIRKGRYPQ